MQVESYWLDTRWLGGSKCRLKLEVVQIEPIVQIEIGVIHVPWKHCTDPVLVCSQGLRNGRTKINFDWTGSWVHLWVRIEENEPPCGHQKCHHSSQNRRANQQPWESNASHSCQHYCPWLAPAVRERHTQRQSMNQFNSPTPPKTVNHKKPEGEWALPSTDTIAIIQKLVFFRNWSPDFDLCYGCKLNSTTTGRSAMQDWCDMRNFSPLDCKYIAGGQAGRVAPLQIVLEIVTTYTINWTICSFEVQNIMKPCELMPFLFRLEEIEALIFSNKRKA